MGGPRHALAARRRAIGLSQQDLAERVGVTRSTIIRLESGESTPRPWYRPLYAEALQVSLGRLDELLEQTATIRRSASSDTAGGLLLPEAVDDSTHAAAGPEYVQSVRQTAAHLIDLDTQHGGDDVVRLAVRAFQSAYRQLSSGLYVPEVERDLSAAVGELAEVASWAAFDANQQALARQLVHEALFASRSAGDRTMELFELAHLAMQSIYLRRPAEALRVAGDVINDNRLSGRTEAAFRVRLARALGQTGQRQRGLDELRRARSLVHDGLSSDDPSWTWWLDDAELAWHEGMMLADLNELPAAVEHFRAAYDLRPVELRRARYNDLAHLLHALVDIRAWHDAESSAGELLAHGDDVSSARTAALLRSAADAIRRGRPGPTSTLSDAADAIAAQLAGRPNNSAFVAET
jgi:transcriptional regulator with XRE-family HTH domain